LPAHEIAEEHDGGVAALKQDQVVLVQGLDPEQANALMMSVADSLKVQAAFASSLGHRENVGQYYMR
jgi:hypothetical protein